jgi:hypothetical protein
LRGKDSEFAADRWDAIELSLIALSRTSHGTDGLNSLDHSEQSEPHASQRAHFLINLLQLHPGQLRDVTKFRRTPHARGRHPRRSAMQIQERLYLLQGEAQRLTLLEEADIVQIAFRVNAVSGPMRRGSRRIRRRS